MRVSLTRRQSRIANKILNGELMLIVNLDRRHTHYVIDRAGEETLVNSKDVPKITKAINNLKDWELVINKELLLNHLTGKKTIQRYELKKKKQMKRGK